MNPTTTATQPVTLPPQSTQTGSITSPYVQQPQSSVDTGVINLAKAIRQHESGNDFNAVGDNGTSKGAYQWQPGNFESAATKFGLDPNDFSPANQNAVAYSQIKSLKDQGLNVAQIAATWNSGSPDNWENKIGTTNINGKQVSYNVPEYVKSVADLYQQFKNGSANPTDTSDPNSSNQPLPPQTSPGVSPLLPNALGGKFFNPFSQEIGKTLANVGELGLKGLRFLTPRNTEAYDAENSGVNKLEDYKGTVNDQLNSETGVLPTIGKVVGSIAPYTVGAGEISGAADAAAGLVGDGAGILPAIGRTAASAATEGALSAGQGYVLSGGNVKDAETQGITSGVLGGVLSGAGEALKGLGVDEKLMGTVYKTNAKEQGNILFGSQTDSLAKQAVDHGLTGGVENQAAQIKQGLADSEQKVLQEFTDAGNPTITLNDPQRFISAVKNKADLLEKGGATEAAQGLKSSLGAINPETGEITATNALALRRFLDGLQYEKSFVTPTEELSASQAGLKEMSNELRGKINSIGDTSSAMKDYQFYINAKNSLAKYAARTQNKAIIGVLDEGLGLESLGSGNPTAAGLGLVNKVIKPASKAQIITKLPEASTAGVITRKTIGLGLQNAQDTTPLSNTQ